MLLLKDSFIRNFVDQETYNRGCEYAERGRVTSLRIQEPENNQGISLIQADVEGSKIYEVTVRCKGGVVQSSCSCPKRTKCHHIVALFLVSQQSFSPKSVLSKQKNAPLSLSEETKTLNLLKMAKKAILSSNVEEADKALHPFFEMLMFYPVDHITLETLNKRHTLIPLLMVNEANQVGIALAYATVLKSGFSKNLICAHAKALMGSIGFFYRVMATFLSLLPKVSPPPSIEASRLSFFHLQGVLGGRLLKILLQKTQIFTNTLVPVQKVEASVAPISFVWSKNVHGLYVLSMNQNGCLIATDPLFVFDPQRASLEEVSSTLYYEDLIYGLSLNGSSLEVLNSLREDLEKTSLPKVPTYSREDEWKQPPIPVMRFQMHIKNGQEVIVAELMCRYGECDDFVEVDPFDGDLALFFLCERDQTRYNVVRNVEEEKRIIDLCHCVDLIKVYHPFFSSKSPSNIFVPLHSVPSSSQKNPLFPWIPFLHMHKKVLQAEGWILDTGLVFKEKITLSDEDSSYCFVEETGENWFSTELGISVDGEKVNLLPLLLNLLKTHKNILQNLERDVPSLDNDSFIVSDGTRLIVMPKGRALEFLRFLQDFFDRPLKEGRINLSYRELFYLDLWEKSNQASQLRWFGAYQKIERSRYLNEVEHLPLIEPSPNIRATLRPYQIQGFSWMCFLTQYNLSGILADDMGLGKTIQTIAYILHQKEKESLMGPILIVAPTSLMPNWSDELKKFAPSLSFVVLQGSTRDTLFSKIQSVDIVLTTYPLLYRDRSLLMPHSFHTIILDEAHLIKNSKSQTALVAHQLVCKNRFCLTGTPMENHLGELWSLFHFLMPGYLGNESNFNRLYKNPIQKQNDMAQANVLKRRIAPFILRRTKDDVLVELPPKTETVLHSFMEKRQRDLYETYRLSLHMRIRQEISKLGFARSHIVVLEALLKLRQICCDPRLLKTERDYSSEDSSKLKQLMLMIPSMIEEGRKILLFSQFVTMLNLIEKECQDNNIPYTILTGSTRDRKTPVDLFQTTSVPLFLISLKAGGTGLNLTAADTVIHYDPWWNPAVEVQATDRAHRIGQQKPVFVYKMIASETIEEKIRGLQSRKQNLSQEILDAKSRSFLEESDIDDLFE